MDTCCKKSEQASSANNKSLKWWVCSPLFLLINVYQLFISPLLGPSCRFEPTCSHYAKDALTRHGLIKGMWLAIKRLAKCHPWGKGGYDPVPK